VRLDSVCVGIVRHTVIRKPILYASSLVRSGRYSAVRTIAGGIVYLTCLIKIISLAALKGVSTYTSAYSNPIPTFFPRKAAHLITQQSGESRKPKSKRQNAGLRSRAQQARHVCDDVGNLQEHFGIENGGLAERGLVLVNKLLSRRHEPTFSTTPAESCTCWCQNLVDVINPLFISLLLAWPSASTRLRSLTGSVAAT
jgi:hypothetical protein